MLLWLKALLLISSSKSVCDLMWRGQDAKPVEDPDFFKEQIPIYWKRLTGNSRCVHHIRVNQKRGDERMEITYVFQRQLKKLGGAPFKVRSKFGNCSSATYTMEIEVTDDQNQKYEIKANLNPLEMLSQFDETKTVQTVETEKGLGILWKEGGMFERGPQLVNCISRAEIRDKDDNTKNNIPIQYQRAFLPQKDLFTCETYEVRYYFFAEQQKMKKANFIFPSKEHCANRTQDLELEARQNVNCENPKTICSTSQDITIAVAGASFVTLVLTLVMVVVVLLCRRSPLFINNNFLDLAPARPRLDQNVSLCAF